MEPSQNANERFYLGAFIILDCTVEKGAAALRGYQLAKTNRYWKCTLTSGGTINQRGRWPLSVPQITVMKPPVSHESNTNFKEETTAHKEENLDIVSSRGYCAIKDPRLEWQKYPRYQSINQMLYKARKVCLCSNSSTIVEADVAMCSKYLH